MMTYTGALTYLYSRCPMYQRQGKSAYNADLNNIISLLNMIGNPQTSFKSVHIAGTNGKGTSAHAIAAILQMAGYKVGLYTSPHLKTFTERIKINGEEVAKDWMAHFVTHIKLSIERINPSFFEITLAMAFQYFSEKNVDIAVVETGLGGRLDSTNILIPEVCLVTNIGLDHTDLLGDTIEKIAAEKAGIIKPHVPVVIGDMTGRGLAVMKKFAEQSQSQLIETRPTKSNHYSQIPYFKRNIPGVLGVIKELRNKGWNISTTDEQIGLRDFTSMTGLKGRYQLLEESPKVIADISHNLDGLTLLFRHINTQNFNRLHIIYGSIKDKLLDPILKIIPSNSSYYFTQSSVPRSLDAKSLKAIAKKINLFGGAYQDVNDAKKAALHAAASDDLILITGSAFVVGEVEEL